MPLSFHVQHFDVLDSTNKEILRQASLDAKEGLVVVANTQTDGKGRLGRKWHTIEHALAMSVLLRPDISPTDVPKLSLVAALALHDSLSLFTPHIGIKWPNDLLAKGKKLSGILTEMRSEGNDVKAVVLGMGINISEPQQGWADDITSPATSLNQISAQNIQKEHVLQAVLESLSVWYERFLKEGFKPIQEAWWHVHIASNQMVSVHDGNRYIEGIAIGLADDGALRLLVNGTEQRIIAGDVSIMDNKT